MSSNSRRSTVVVDHVFILEIIIILAKVAVKEDVHTVS